jgi:hypothetical protein
MATLAQLKSKVIDVIKDPHFRSSSVTKYLNSAVTDIAGGLPSSFGHFLSPPLPNLFQIDTVSTDTSFPYVAMPTTFQRDLVFAANASGAEVDIANSWIDFAGTNPLLDQSGTIYEVIEIGGRLYYQGIPTSSEELTLHFYRLPVDMTSDSDEPDGIPDHFQERLLVSYTAYRTYEIIGEVPKAEYYKELFQKAFADFELSLPFDTRSLNLH